MKSVDGMVVVTLAVRIESPSKASSPKKAPAPRRTGVGLDIDLHFAGGDEIHAIADLAAANDGGPFRHFEPPQHVRDFGDRRRVERLEKRHLADEVPGLNEIAPPVFGGKTGGENAGRQAECGDAADHDEGAEQMSQLRQRHRVAVAGRRQRHDRPPHRLRAWCRTGPAAGRARVTIHRGRRQKQNHQKQREHARQRLCLEHEDAADLRESRASSARA